jgi:hypothetical protein
MKTLVIETRGGAVQDVYTDEDIRVILVDWDECEEEIRKSCASKLFPSWLSAMPDDTRHQLGGVK